MIKDYLPKASTKRNQDPNKQIVQGSIDKELVLKVKSIKDKNGLSWDDLITACLKNLVDEMGK